MIITVFRSRLREESHVEYSIVAEETERLARAMPGFVSFKTFAAPDGERCSIVEFDSSFSISVAEVVRHHQFEFEGEIMSDLQTLNESLHEDVKPQRHAAYPIDATFLNRWSPYAFSSEPVDEEALISALEAARWAASSYNEQPWRFLIARNAEDHQKFVDFLIPQNQVWAKTAPVLLLVIAKKTFSHNGNPNGCHQYDAGTASGYLTFQLAQNGLHSHGMAGFDKEAACASLGIPSDFEPMAVYAIGHRGDKSQLPPQMQARDAASGRRPIQDSVMEGRFIEPEEERAEAETDTPDLPQN